MPYISDRQWTIRDTDIVAVVGMGRRRVRSRVILRDNSLYHTLTRPRTLIRRANGIARTRRSSEDRTGR